MPWQPTTLAPIAYKTGLPLATSANPPSLWSQSLSPRRESTCKLSCATANSIVVFTKLRKPRFNGFQNNRINGANQKRLLFSLADPHADNVALVPSGVFWVVGQFRSAKLSTI